MIMIRLSNTFRAAEADTFMQRYREIMAKYLEAFEDKAGVVGKNLPLFHGTCMTIGVQWVQISIALKDYAYINNKVWVPSSVLSAMYR